MGGLFGSLSVSASGMDVYKTWLDATSDNVANINTINPAGQPAYQEKFVQAQSVANGPTGGGVQVTAIQLGTAAGIPVYDPTNPLADPKTGVVLHPAENLADQMTNLMIAQRAYQANVSSFKTARDAYTEALTIGQS